MRMAGRLREPISTRKGTDLDAEVNRSLAKARRAPLAWAARPHKVLPRNQSSRVLPRAGLVGRLSRRRAMGHRHVPTASQITAAPETTDPSNPAASRAPSRSASRSPGSRGSSRPSLCSSLDHA